MDLNPPLKLNEKWSCSPKYLALKADQTHLNLRFEVLQPIQTNEETFFISHLTKPTPLNQQKKMISVERICILYLYLSVFSIFGNCNQIWKPNISLSVAFLVPTSKWKSNSLSLFWEIRAWINLSILSTTNVDPRIIRVGLSVSNLLHSVQDICQTLQDF